MTWSAWSSAGLPFRGGDLPENLQDPSCLFIAQALPVDAGGLVGAVRKKSPLGIGSRVFSCSPDPRCRKRFERGGFTSAPEVASQDSRRGSIFEFASSQVLEDRQHRAVGLAVLPVKQPITARKVFVLCVEAHHSAGEAGFGQNRACSKKMPHAIEHHTFPVFFASPFAAACGGFSEDRIGN